METKEHLQKIEHAINEMREDGHLTDLELVRWVNGAEYEISKALKWAGEQCNT